MDKDIAAIGYEPRQQLTADAFYASMTEIKQQLISVIPGGHFLRQDCVCAMATGMPSAAFNCVWLERPQASIATVTALLDAVAGIGVPYSLRLRPGCGEMFTLLAEAREMGFSGELTLMAVQDAVTINNLPQPKGLVIRQLAPREASQHALVAAPAFGVPRDAFMRAVGPDLLRLDTVRCYVGEVDGRPVATSLSVTHGVMTGIFNVVTVPGFRGCGFGAAVTAKTVSDGLAADSKWCWLEAEPLQVSSFRKVGFQAIEPWQCWETIY